DTGRYVPAHQRYWRLAEALGRGDRRRETHVPISAAARAWAAEALCDLRPPFIAVHAGARWRTKRWPVEKFAVIAAKAARRFGGTTLIVGTADERPLAAQLRFLLRKFVPAAPVRDLTGRTTLPQLAAVLDAADVLISNDSGPMHLAAGLDTPVVGVFTCTSPLRSGPPPHGHELLTTNLSCAACYRRRCRYRGKKHMACLEEISTDRVWEAVVRLMERRYAKAA
ncbi:MAG: glycosyltransferase family 9 protein, partial [Planctomycetaceae bacterium]